MDTVISKDGTKIAFERSGSGPPVILVDGAFCSRAFGPMPKLAPHLAKRFTVLLYDRRGRGESGDTAPYAAEREVEDLAALVQAAGGQPGLLGLSSGGALALLAAANGVPVRKVVAYEPPFVHEGGQGANHGSHLRTLIAEGKRGDAIRYFMRDMVGAPAFVPVMMRLMPWVWNKLSAAAHTLPYDAEVMGDFRVPAERLRSVPVPALVLHGSKADARMQAAARRTAESIPGARLEVLAGQTHNVNPAVLALAVADFLGG